MSELREHPGNKKVFLQINDLDNSTRRGIRQGLFQFGDDLVRTANQQILKKPKSGITRLVRRGKTRRRHTASAPGESPANLSGNYRRSIGYKLQGTKGLIFGAGNSEVPYAEALELGNRKNGMKPRPGLGNAVKATERNGIKYLENNIKRFVKK